ncbi:MAG: hypothetical protein ACREIS_04205 [Nitrospiraceae bacterium]
MSTTAREAGIQTLHDQVVSQVAQRWAKSVQSQITINTDAERNRWAGSDRRYPDILGWKLLSGRNTIDWIAEVETEESVTEDLARGRWRDYAALGVPFYLFVPKGWRTTAQQLAAGSHVKLNGVYEYAFVSGTFQLS